MQLVVCLLIGVLAFANAQYDYDDVLYKSLLFYEAQRSGQLPANNRIPWRGNSAMGDQGQGGEDLTGGWYDAGDHVKFGFPMASSATVLAWSIVDFRAAWSAAGELNNALAAIKWPLDYFIKAHTATNEFYGQIGTGDLDHAVWGRAEDMEMERPSFFLDTANPGSDLAGETAAAMAAGSMAFQQTDPAYASTLLTHARQLHEFAYTYNDFYHNSITDAENYYMSYGWQDEIAWSAIWLYRATGEALYLSRAEEYYDGGVAWAFDWDDKHAGTQLLMYKATGQATYSTAVENFVREWMPGGGIPYTPLGLAFRSQWGSLRYACNAAFIALAAAQEGIIPAEATAFGTSQIHYALGDTGRSFVCGFGNNPPTQPHHAGASCEDPPAPCDWSDFDKPGPNPNILYGALVGGPGMNDEYVDDRTDYIANEVTCDYNSGFTASVAILRLAQLQKEA